MLTTFFHVMGIINAFIMLVGISTGKALIAVPLGAAMMIYCAANVERYRR